MGKTVSIVVGFFSAVLSWVIVLTGFLVVYHIFNALASRYLIFSAVGVVSLTVFFLVRKRNPLLAISQLVSVALIFISLLFVLQNFKSAEEEKVHWNSTQDSFLLDFIVRKGGVILMKAKVNGVPGLFVFDTGAAFTVVNEKFIQDADKRTESITMFDANKLNQSGDKVRIKDFQLGGMQLYNLIVVPLDSAAWTHKKGIFHGDDIIVGIIGNNLISKFVWDFDLQQKKVTVSRNREYCAAIPDSLGIDLVPFSHRMKMPVYINGFEKMLVLDFGSIPPIILSDSVAVEESDELGKINAPQSTRGMLSHIDTVNGRTHNGKFTDVRLGDNEFSDILCLENAKSDLIGIPFIWSFERVILDYNHQKSYFISRKRKDAPHGAESVSRENLSTHLLRNSTVTTFYSNSEGMVLHINRDSVTQKYISFGKLLMYRSQNSTKPDSIICCDSVLLPDGSMKYGPFKIE